MAALKQSYVHGASEVPLIGETIGQFLVPIIERARYSVTLRWPPKTALEGRRPGAPRPFILRGSLRSHLRGTE